MTEKVPLITPEMLGKAAQFLYDETYGLSWSWTHPVIVFLENEEQRLLKRRSHLCDDSCYESDAFSGLLKENKDE